MDAQGVRDALRRRWPDSEYLSIEEAPQDPMRQGRKIDVLVVSLWKSRGHALDAVEIKVSMTDWKRELENAAKADWWWEHVHRFWIACPLELAPRIRDQLPETWGLLACTPDATKVVVQAPRRDPAPLSWPQCIGLMRASANAGLGALQRAEQRGYDRGKQHVSGERAAERLRELQEQVRAAEEAIGIPLAGISAGHAWDYAPLDQVHAAVRTVLHDERAGERARQALDGVEQQLQRALEAIAKARAESAEGTEVEAVAV